MCNRASFLALQDVNSAIVATNAGTRLTLGELDADGVEAWVDHKKAQVRATPVSSLAFIAHLVITLDNTSHHDQALV